MDRKEVCEGIWSGDSGIQKEYPPGKEDYDSRLGTYLSDLVGPIFVEYGLCEVGCGSGRLAKFFPDDEYIGVDINKSAIAKAKTSHPYHRFQVVGYEEDWPEASVYLFHTVLLHIPDEYLPGMIQRCKKQTVILAETMDSKFRDGKYTFHRSPEQYIQAFQEQGYRVVETRRMYIEGFPGFWDLHKYVFGGEKA